MILRRSSIAILGTTLALLTAGCVTNPSTQAPPVVTYTPTELAGKSTEDLRAELQYFLELPASIHRAKPISLIYEQGPRWLEVGEDYVFIRVEQALYLVTEPRRDEYYRYGFLLEDLSVSGDTCNGNWARLVDGGIRFDAPPGRRFCDVLHTLSLRAQRQRDADEARFAQLASQARGRATVTVPESLRRLVVEAEALRQDKDYAAAASTFRKLIHQDPVAYPAAHFNLALLYEMLGDYPRAIQSMRRYLALQPQAADARAGQDKIYEWEMRAGKR